MVRHVYQDRDLCRGCLRIGGQTIDLAAISRTALLTVEGERDDIAGPGQTKAAHRLCRSVSSARRRHMSIKEAGHFALFHGRAWRQQVLPEIIRCQESASLHR
jgi:poly(3-hydroxybutyrate) depolymerase